jgi:hypothetical protein
VVWIHGIIILSRWFQKVGRSIESAWNTDKGERLKALA